jgi:hypothetical protein
VFIPIAILGYGVIRDIRQFNRDVSSVIDKSRLYFDGGSLFIGNRKQVKHASRSLIGNRLSSSSYCRNRVRFWLVSFMVG